MPRLKQKTTKEEPPDTIRGLQLGFTDDNMSAFLSLAPDMIDSVEVAAIKDLLNSEGVCHGIIEEEKMKHYLEEFSLQGQPLEVAQGDKPILGEDAKITYYFDTDPLKIGTLKQEGTIDYRDRGEIPHVSKGTMLARVEPVKPGKPGIDVFGKEVLPPQPKDIKLRCGKGIVKSEDGMVLHAAQDGQPVVTSDEKISVVPKLRISGDIGLETGHVHFDGEVDVTGSVHDGFRVQATRLVASEIGRADITVSGDVIVSGGIIGATIRGEGNLKARYIHAARIHTLGDVVIEKEVIDSDIITSGAFLIRKGKIFNSRISAKNGIEAEQIGSEESKPCLLTVGIDDGAMNRIEWLKEQKRNKKAKCQKLERITENLRSFSNGMHGEIAELAQTQDRGMLEQKDLKEKLDRQKGEGYGEEVSSLDERINELATRIRMAEKRLAKRMEQQEKVVDKAVELGKKVEEITSECVAIKEDIRDLYAWSQSTGSNPLVKVRDDIFSHTSIKAPHTSAQLPKKITRSIIREKRVPQSNGRGEKWKLVATPLK